MLLAGLLNLQGPMLGRSKGQLVSVAGFLRHAFRVLVLALGGPLVARQTVTAWRYYAAWRDTLNDPSARDAYLTFFEVELAQAVGLLLIMGLLLWVLRPRGS